MNQVYNLLSIFLSGNCNLNCSYCFLDKKNLKKFELNSSQIKKGIDLFLNYPGKEKTIVFTGGEPLKYYSLIKKVSLYSILKSKTENKILHIVVSTNGTLLSKEKYKFFLKNNICLSISLDGKQFINDFYRKFKSNSSSVFQRVWKNIQNFDKKNIKISSVFTPFNQKFLLESINFLKKEGFPEIDFYPELFSIWRKNEIKKLKKTFSSLSKIPAFSSFGQKKEDSFLRKNCNRLVLAPDGNFYLCDKVLSFFDKRREKYMVGNLKRGINEKLRQEMLNKISTNFSKETNHKCKKCKYLNYCFCPVGIYLWCLENKKDFKPYFKNFCQISQLYILNFKNRQYV